MKKVIYSLFLIILTINVAGQSKEELKNSKSILWLGLDFTEARFESKYDFGTPEELTGKYVAGWNQVILQEPEKFDLETLFGFEKVDKDIGIALKRNDKLDKEKIFLGLGEINDYSLNEEIIQKIVSGYDLEYDGYALLFIVESYSKTAVNGNIWVTYFHVPTKKVIQTKKMSGKPKGFGIRNYWTGSVFEIMRACSEQ